MKKLFLFLFSLFLSFFSINAFAEDNSNRVFKLESYKFHELTNSYEKEQYGSAILVDDDLIYTNAHVILDDKGEPFGNYRVCRTINFRENPECFSVGELLYYDETNDLAVLKISKIDISPVTFSNKEINIGDRVNVYGYPLTGGETITFTQGKISGYESGLYKIDAGNSGGGVFDDNGDLIGIAVSVKVGYTTLGYIVPISKLNEFKNKLEHNNIINYDKKIDLNFSNYVNLLNDIFRSSIFSNKEISINNFKKYGFDIHSYGIDNNNDFYYLIFSDESKENMIQINNIEYIGNDKSIFNYLLSQAKKDRKKQKELGNLKVNKIVTIKIWGYDAFLSLGVYNDDSVSLNLIVERSINNYLDVSIISGNGLKDINFRKGLSIVFKNLKLKKLESKDYTATDLYELDNLVLKKLSGFHLKKVKFGETIHYNKGDINIEGPSTYEFDKQDYKLYTFSSYLKEKYFYVKDSVYLNNCQINKTFSGDYYTYFFGINNKGKGLDNYEHEDKYFIMAEFVDQKNEENFYLNKFLFTFNDEQSKKIIDDLLKNIKTTGGTNVFKLGDIKVGENLIKEAEFDFNSSKN